MDGDIAANQLARTAQPVETVSGHPLVGFRAWRGIDKPRQLGGRTALKNVYTLPYQVKQETWKQDHFT